MNQFKKIIVPIAVREFLKFWVLKYEKTCILLVISILSSAVKTNNFVSAPWRFGTSTAQPLAPLTTMRGCTVKSMFVFIARIDGVSSARSTVPLCEQPKYVLTDICIHICMNFKDI